MKNLLTVLALSVLPTVLYGDVAYNVSLDTSPLIGAPAGQFWLAFQISDGSGTGDGNNLAALSGFRFGTGEASGLPILIGSAYGNLSSALVMTDGSGVAYAAEAFNPGPTLTFQLYLTTNVDSGPLPDLFAFSILDHTFTPIPTKSAAIIIPRSGSLRPRRLSPRPSRACNRRSRFLGARRRARPARTISPGASRRPRRRGACS